MLAKWQKSVNGKCVLDLHNLGKDLELTGVFCVTSKIACRHGNFYPADNKHVSGCQIDVPDLHSNCDYTKVLLLGYQ